MAITAGQFNEIGSFNIKFDKKHGENGELLDNVIMHVISQQNNQNRTVIKAERGKIETDEKSNLLKLHLYNGNYYEEIVQKNIRQRNRNPFAKAHFKHYVLSIDLSEFDNSDDEIQKISNTANMMNISQLNYTLDSLNMNLSHEKNIQKETQDGYSTLLLSEATATNNSVLKEIGLDSLLLTKRKVEKISILSNASAVAENIKFTTLNNQNALSEKAKNINRHTVAFYEKFVVAFSCLLMFFVGAPLGAIIRKGGLGLPMVLAVLIFISYHFINTFGRKLAQENGTTAFMGAWLSTLILLPLAIIFTYKATRDRGINSLDNTFYPITNYIKKIFKKKQKNIENV